MDSEDVNHEEHETDEEHEGKESCKQEETQKGHQRRETNSYAAITSTRSMRVSSPLSSDVEDVIRETIGCAIDVHRALGPGFLESIYKNAMRLELEARGLTMNANGS